MVGTSRAAIVTEVAENAAATSQYAGRATELDLELAAGIDELAEPATDHVL